MRTSATTAGRRAYACDTADAARKLKEDAAKRRHWNAVINTDSKKSDGPVMRNCTRIVAPGGQARAGDAKPWRCNGSTSWALVAVLQGEHCIS
ncbi:hypothetical protein [Xanthomonas sp. BRIP62411]|uniref:hypothetical protein n=1 Tax=Xanthomonas sp. BRIP62411 TaxID=2182389 RepID=UPI000F8EBD8F|nr:hypothetical protein [Xanthomonas sp. BRIP62411]